MASIHQDIVIDVPPGRAWDALADLGALHTRLVRGFVIDCQLDGDARDVTFANGVKARERIVDVDPARRRVAWSATGDRLTHHNASAQVLDEPDGRTRVVWVADLLPNAMAPAIAGMIAQGLQAMKVTLESDVPR
ncbi:SRPBCC family protein [Rhizobacter sp. Root1221]|uniref:SRPBCC family protein n=1 Tax=Rhizobacter sp. Root1221 TaxID=1736433 RepID=UPI0006F75037|nr:SRPBCC family protein [Rhizobacter sp. Root1221]KQV89797.1 polyketide cyclase [Rhizobacter sp. Root1221]